MAISTKRWLYLIWILSIASFAVLHALNLSADFPNHTPWISDWAKYTDEGWYGNAAVRAHLFGNWYMKGDFNPAPAVPVWPFLEWMLFSLTGVSIIAARGLAVAFFFANLSLSYLYIRHRGSRFAALLTLTLLVTSPFLYCFSRLAILEPMLTTFTLAALNLAIRLPQFRRKTRVSATIGLLFTLMMLTKTTAVFLLPALGWAMLMTLMPDWKKVARCAMVAAGSFAVSFGSWIAIIAYKGLMADYRYLFFVNKYLKPKEWYWPLESLWWSFHGGLWVDRILIPLTGVIVLAAAVAWRSAWSRALAHSPAFGASLLAVAGYILFMTYQNHPQPRYFAVVTFFSLFVLSLGLDGLLGARRADAAAAEWSWAGGRKGALLLAGCVAIAAFGAACLNAVRTLGYAAHPEFTWVPAAEKLTHYIDEHPNGNRLLLSISGDEITMITHLPSICDDFGTQELVSKLGAYQPGWFATWNDLDPGSLEDLHRRYSLQQVASFHAFDDSDRNVLVLFKLRPLADGHVRDDDAATLQAPLPGDRIGISVE